MEPLREKKSSFRGRPALPDGGSIGNLNEIWMGTSGTIDGREPMRRTVLFLIVAAALFLVGIRRSANEAEDWLGLHVGGR